MKTSWLVAFACCLACGCQRSKTESSEPGHVGTGVDASPASSAGGLLPVGSPLPAVTGTAQNGERVALRELRGKPIVVYFYPKDDTPGCTLEAQEIRDLWKEMQATNAVVVGVSSDDDASHRAFADKHALPFLLLSDSNHAIASAFGVPLKNERATRVSFVFGPDGKLAKVFPAVTPRGHGQELLSAVKSL